MKLFEFQPADVIIEEAPINHKRVKLNFKKMMTVSPTQNQSLQQLVTSHGGVFVESPVLGTASVAKARQLQVMVGGDKKDYDKLEVMLQSLGKPHYLGPVPSASKMKLAFNNLVINNIVGFSNSIAMVEREGLDTDKFMELVRPAQIYTKYFDLKLPSMKSRDYSNISFDIQGMLKDINLIIARAKELGINTAALEGNAAIVQLAAAANEEKAQDAACVYDFINPKK